MIHDIANLRVGDKVHYQPKYYDDNEWENGIIKEIRSDRLDGCWVVYNCAGRWESYSDYTGALTMLSDLHMGWRFK